MRGALAGSQKRRKRGEDYERQSSKRDGPRGGKQQRRGARELQARGQEAPASGVAPALEVGFRVANIEEVDEPRGGERQSRDDGDDEGERSLRFSALHGVGDARWRQMSQIDGVAHDGPPGL